jgi:hypothetical protein
MEDRSWMYRDSPQGLWMMDYYNRLQGFINYALSNREILMERVLDVHARGVKIKSFSIDMM